MDDLSTLALAATAGGGLASLAQLSDSNITLMREAMQPPWAPGRPPAPRDAHTLTTQRRTTPPRPGAATTTPPVPRTFDALFARHGRGVPVPFLRALAWHESRLKPRARNRVATGLLQIIDVVRNDHNRLHGTSYTRDDLHDPVVNITIGAAALRRIITSYGRNHSAIANLREDWNNYRFAELLVLGWNAGWSERAGLGRVARYLTELGARDVTIELIHQHARVAGATEHLQNASKVRWAKLVALHYAAERARDATHRDIEIEMPPEYIDDPPLVAVADDAAPVSSPSQVDPTPIGTPPIVTAPPASVAPPVVAAPPAPPSSMVPLDPYAAASPPASPSSMVPLDPYSHPTG